MSVAERWTRYIHAYRQYAAVEKRYQGTCDEDAYVPLPSEQTMARWFAAEVRPVL